MRALRFVLATALVGACSSGPGPAEPGTLLEFRAPGGTAADTIRLEGVQFGSGRVAVVFAHEFNAGQDAWGPFAREVAARGYRAVTFNFRGYGASEGDRAEPKIDVDLRSVLSVVGAGSDRVFVVGGSMGGMAAIVVAAETPLAGVVTISAPETFRGLDASAAVKRLPAGTPLLVVAGAEDDPYADAARDLYANATQPKQLEIVAGAAEHGSELISAREQVRSLILEFLDSNWG